MVNPEVFYKTLIENNVDFFTGVPDSLLKSFCAYVTDHAPEGNHIITANEGASVGLAIGYHLSTGRIPLLYLQNSGLGNTINPLASLADKEVYSIPMVLMIGWRGEPGVKDEPQHVKQGRITLNTLDVMEIPYEVITEDEVDSLVKIKSMIELASLESKPCAVLVKKGAFSSYKLDSDLVGQFKQKREDAVKVIADSLSKDDLVVATTGMASRELFEHRANSNEAHDSDFLTVGGMGHASQIALGVAKGKPDRNVICIDGDGAAIMHMGSLAISGTSKCKNLKHIVINNGSHDSVGGQPTIAFDVDLTAIAKSSGYLCFNPCSSLTELEGVLPEFLNCEGPAFLEVYTSKGNRSELGRPTTTPLENKEAFMRSLGVKNCN